MTRAKRYKILRPKVLKMYAQGMSINDIIAEIEHPPAYDTIRKWLRVAGIHKQYKLLKDRATVEILVGYEKYEHFYKKHEAEGWPQAAIDAYVLGIYSGYTITPQVVESMFRTKKKEDTDYDYEAVWGMAA